MASDRFQGRTLGLVGGGNMAMALTAGVTSAGLFAPEAVLVSDPAEDRRRLMADLGCRIAAANSEVAGNADIIVFAVKPQVADEVLSELAGAQLRDALWITIMAGVPTRRIEEKLGGSPRVVRVMPNTPMLVSQGAAGVAPGAHATEADVADTVALFEACGAVETLSEYDLDAVTALSGSGPAYFMYLVEALVQAAVEEGMTPSAALKLAAATCRGAGALLESTGDAPETLRARVTSKGGTTEAAIAVLDGADAKGILVKAVRAAAARSRELGRGK